MAAVSHRARWVGCLDIQWYPGHMAKAKKMLREHIALADVVIELLDARVPYSSQNPDIDELVGDRLRIIILNKADLAAPGTTRAWLDFYSGETTKALALNSQSQKGFDRVVSMAYAMTQKKRDRLRERGRTHVPVRAMVVGIPNVGKSTFINTASRRAGAKVADRPGVTRGKQWIKAPGGLDLLDTPGVLWPKFDDAQVGLKLAATGAISDEVYDAVNLCESLLALLADAAPTSCAARYRLTDPPGDPRSLLESIGAARGCLMKGGTIDILRAAVMVLDEFRAGKLGRISLDAPPNLGKPAPTLSTPPQS